MYQVMNQSDELQSQQSGAHRYVAAFEDWMAQWQPDVFVTINLPNAPSPQKQIRSHEFYLSLWTRIADTNLTTRRHVSHGNPTDRTVWIFRREVSPDGLIHYHALAKTSDAIRRAFPVQWDIACFCASLQRDLKLASSRTPEPFKRKNEHLPICADIDVRPASPHHYEYLVKQVTWPSIYDHERVDSVIQRDSGLFIFPGAKRTSMLGKDTGSVLVN